MTTSEPTAALLTDLTLAEAAAALRDGVLTSIQLVRAGLERAEATKELNIFVTLDAEGALRAAAEADAAREAGAQGGPLAGIPIVVKDNIHSAGLRTTAGSPAFADYVPVEDAPALHKLREAGAIVLGKTNMHELAFGATGYNSTFNTGRGPGVRNAYDSTRIAGGSSSGSAAALGARIALAALGTDTGGSMRIPPALNGVVGLRPSYCRYSGAGVIPIARTRDMVGPMALTVADAALLDAVITGEWALPQVTLGQLRLGLPGEFWQNLDADTRELAEAAKEMLAAHGVTLVPLPETGLLALNEPVGFSVVVHEAYDSMVDYLRQYGHGFSIEELAQKIQSPDVRTIYENWVLPRKLPRANGQLVDVTPIYQAAQGGGRAALRQRYREIFEGHRLDALLFPTTAVVAPRADDSIYQEENFRFLIQNTEPIASAGQPGLTLPIGRGARSGLPVGIELDGPAASDRRLLAIGIALESIFGRIPAPAVAS